MSGSTIGNIFKITTWGESHGKGLGVVIDGCPAGIPLCEEDIKSIWTEENPAVISMVQREAKAILYRLCLVFLKVKPPEHQFL